jgi:hypothetical protein
MDYDIKKGYYQKLEGDGLRTMMEESFGKVASEGPLLVASYGALARVDAELKGKKVLAITTKMNTTVSEDVAVDTMRRYYKFLEKATGYTAKERGKKAQKKASKSDADAGDAA